MPYIPTAEDINQQKKSLGEYTPSAEDIKKYKDKIDEEENKKPINYAKDVLAGTAQYGHELLNLPYNITKLFSDKLASYIPHQQKYDFGKMVGVTKPSPTDVAIQDITSTLPAFAIPETKIGEVGDLLQKIPAAGKYLEKALGTAIPQAGFAGAQALENAPEDAGKAALSAGLMSAPFGAVSEMIRSGSPIMKNLGRAGAFGGATLAAEQGGQSIGLPSGVSYPAALLMGYLAQKGVRPSTAAQRSVFGDVAKENLPKAKERLAGARRLGLEYITPAEAFKSPTLAKAQGSIGRTEQGSQLAIEKGEKRTASEQSSINNLLDTIYEPKKHYKEKTRGYAELENRFMPDSFVAKSSQDPIISHAISKIETDPVYKKAFKDVPTNSMVYWDQVKKIMDDMQSKALEGRRPQRFKASTIRHTKNNMINEMENTYPEYSKTLGLAQREIIRNQLSDTFDKKDMTGNNFYKALQSDKKFEKLIKDLKDVPEAQDKLIDMKMLFNDLISPPSVRTAAQAEKTSMTKARDSVQGVKDFIGNIFGQGHDKAAVELMTSPEWDKNVEKMLGTSNKAKAMALFVNALGKASAQATAKDVINQREPQK